MKVRELIEQLQELDPELHVEIPTGPAWFVGVLPAYYDGVHCQLITDPNAHYYNVLGFKYTYEGSKVVIYSHSIADAMLDDPEIPVDLSELPGDARKRHEEAVEKMRKEYREL